MPVYYSKISITPTIEEIEIYKDGINFREIQNLKIISQKVLEKYENLINWSEIVKSTILTPEELKKYFHHFTIDDLLNFQPMINEAFPYLTPSERNRLAKIYERTKNRGWFVGYVERLEINSFASPKTFLDFNTFDYYYIEESFKNIDEFRDYFNSKNIEKVIINWKNVRGLFRYDPTDLTIKKIRTVKIL